MLSLGLFCCKPPLQAAISRGRGDCWEQTVPWPQEAGLRAAQFRAHVMGFQPPPPQSWDQSRGVWRGAGSLPPRWRSNWVSCMARESRPALGRRTPGPP